MLQRLVHLSIRFRGVVIALACLTVGYGIYAVSGAKYDVYPEFAPPLVEIQTEAPGLSPEEVEELVTRPIENTVNGVANLESLRSQSAQGLSIVTAIFAEHSDIFRSRQMVAERLAELAGQLPQGVQAPVMAPMTSAASLVLAVGLTSDKVSLMDLRTFADWTLRPRLIGVPGVAKAAVFGGEVRQTADPGLARAAGRFRPFHHRYTRRGACIDRSPRRRVCRKRRGADHAPDPRPVAYGRPTR